MKKTFLALLLAFSPALWAGTPAYAHPLSPAECEGLHNYVHGHGLRISASSTRLQVYALLEEKKERKKILRKSASNLEEMHETLKQIAAALGCPLPKKETGKKPSKKQSKKQKK